MPLPKSRKKWVVYKGAKSRRTLQRMTKARYLQHNPYPKSGYAPAASVPKSRWVPKTGYYDTPAVMPKYPGSWRPKPRRVGRRYRIT